MDIIFLDLPEHILLHARDTRVRVTAAPLGNHCLSVAEPLWTPDAVVCVQLSRGKGEGESDDAAAEGVVQHTGQRTRAGKCYRVQETRFQAQNCGNDDGR